jgi:hypothetical protein
MKNPLCMGLMAIALLATPACASLRPLDAPNPIAAAKTTEQKALAIIESYAVMLEEAADLVADPNVPLAVKRALGRAEQIATPAIDVVRIAFAQYLRARADMQTAQAKDSTAIERTSAALAVAAVRLNEALAQARTPIAALTSLIAQEKRP